MVIMRGCCGSLYLVILCMIPFMFSMYFLGGLLYTPVNYSYKIFTNIIISVKYKETAYIAYTKNTIDQLFTTIHNSLNYDDDDDDDDDDEPHYYL